MPPKGGTTNRLKVWGNRPRVGSEFLYCSSPYFGNFYRSARLGRRAFRQQFDVIELASEHCFAVAFKPPIEERCIHAPEIDRVFQVAIVEVIETGMLAHRAPFDR